MRDELDKLETYQLDIGAPIKCRRWIIEIVVSK